MILFCLCDCCWLWMKGCCQVCDGFEMDVERVHRSNLATITTYWYCRSAMDTGHEQGKARRGRPAILHAHVG